MDTENRTRVLNFYWGLINCWCCFCCCYRHHRRCWFTTELCVEGRQVSHSWYMCVVGHGYGGLGGGRDGDGMHTGYSQGFFWHVGGCWSTSYSEVVHWWHRIIPLSRCAALGRFEPEFVGLSGKAYAWDIMRRLRLVVMPPIGCTPWCFMDARVSITSLREMPVKHVYNHHDGQNLALHFAISMVVEGCGQDVGHRKR